MITKEKWFTNWEKEIPKDYLKNLHQESVFEIMEYLDGFLNRQIAEKQYEVLNAQPGHGKTTALKVFIKKIIEQKLPIGGLIVIREKEQMREVEQFVSENSQGMLYVDSDNYHEVKAHIFKYQFVIISHERLRNIVLNLKKVQENENISNKSKNHVTDEFTRWEERKRIIIIDEAPSFVDTAVFEIDNNLDWLDDCFQAAKEIFSSEEIIMNRSLIQILMAKELLENKGPLTGALKRHLVDSEKFAMVLKNFFKEVDYHIDNLTSSESLSKYQWFKKLFNQDHVGYIDSGLYLDGYSDHKKIICSEKIDYKLLECSILILDGTAIHIESIYEVYGYRINSLKNYTKYERLFIHQRRIKTSARRRKANRGLTVQRLIATDIATIKVQGIDPFPLMNKFEVKEYLNLQVISKHYKQYFSKSSDKGPLPINILNTIGKNYLANQNSMYLTSLPNRPAVYYKAIAISLYKEDEIPLNLSMAQKEKENNLSWFVDQRIEAIYKECLMSELIQIIHRSNIRNLLEPSQKEVHIYIATKFDNLIETLINTLDTRIKFDVTPVEERLKFQITLEDKIKLLIENIEKNNIRLPKAIGKIESGSAIKSYINTKWKKEENRQLIIDTFQKYGYTILVKVNQAGKAEKRIDYKNKALS
jgi:hypothetical protein